MSSLLTDAAYPTPDEIRDTMLRAIRFVYARLGITRNVLPGSDDYVRIEKLAARVGIAIANNEIGADNSDPLTAVGMALITLAAVFGVFPRPAGPGAGAVNIATVGSVAVSIPSNFTATAPNGKKYRATPGTYAASASIPVLATSPGADTNQLAGTILTWDSAAIFALSPSATVTAAGITGGVDADDEEALRARLLERLAAAAGGGNWAEVVAWAENSSASIQAAYEYSAAQGPASYDVAATKKGGDRTLPLLIVQAMAAYVRARMPGQQQGNFTSVTAEYVDITLVADLPPPQLSGGDGGGWLDAAPWPAEDAHVTAYNSGTGVATVNTTAPPTVGASIGAWDPSYVDPLTGAVGQMLSYSVATVAGGAGAWLITVQNGWTVSPLLAYLSAGAVSLAEYARTFAAQVALVGPGQKTALPELLPRAAREPAPDLRAPCNITDRLKGVVEDTYPEILDLTYALRVATGTSTPLASPSIPATTADPPNVLVLKQFAIHA